MNKIKTFAVMLISSIIVWGSANAADWPSKNDKITIVVPFKSGGSTDRLGRSIAQYLPEYLNGAAVTVVNKPGASGAVGASWFLQQPDDGSTFLVTHAVPYLANNILLSNSTSQVVRF